MSDEQTVKDQEIQAGERIERFLADDEVQAAFARLERKYYDEFKAAADPAARESAWAKSRAMEDVKTELRVSVTRGAVAKATSQRRQPR